MHILSPQLGEPPRGLPSIASLEGRLQAPLGPDDSDTNVPASGAENPGRSIGSRIDPACLVGIYPVLSVSRLATLEWCMAVEITIRVPDELGRQLEQYRERWPDLLELGLRSILATSGDGTIDERAIIAVLTSQPTPEQVLAIGPSSALDERVRELVGRSKDAGLSREEEAELDRYFYLEHLVRLAKAQALEQLHQRGG